MLFGNRRRRESRIHYLTTLKGAVGMLRDPHHTESVFDIEDGLRDIEATWLAMEHVGITVGGELPHCLWSKDTLLKRRSFDESCLAVRFNLACHARV